MWKLLTYYYLTRNDSYYEKKYKRSAKTVINCSRNYDFIIERGLFMYQKIIWINCAKFIAVLAVVLDHAKDIIYRNDNIKTSTFFSVTVLIFLAGMTSFYSNEMHKNAPILTEFFRSCAVVFFPFTIPTVFL